MSKNLFYLGEIFQPESVLKIKDIIPKLHIKPLSFTTQETGPIGFQCSEINGDIYHLVRHIQVKSNPENDELIVSVFILKTHHTLNTPLVMLFILHMINHAIVAIIAIPYT